MYDHSGGGQALVEVGIVIYRSLEENLRLRGESLDYDSGKDY